MDLPVCQDRVNRYHHCNDGPDAYLSSPTFPGEELKAEVVHAGARVAAGRICVRGRLVDKSTLRLRYEVCAQSPDAHTDGGLGAVLIHTMVVAVAVAAISFAAQAQSSPEHLVRLSMRTFDLATDVTKLRRDVDFIPMNDISWLGPILDADPVLGPTVFHLKMADPSMVSASWLWQWEVNQDQQPGSGQSYDYKYSRNIPERFQIPGYETRANNEDGLGGVIMIPSDPNADYAISCSQDRKTGVLVLCVVKASYPPDPLIYLQSRLYFPKNWDKTREELDDIVARMREVATCLDVTTRELEFEADGLPKLTGCKTGPGT